MKLSKIISNDKSFLYETLISSSQNCEEYLINFNPSKNIQNLMLNELDFFEAMQFQDLNNYLLMIFSQKLIELVCTVLRK